jgi:mRNA-degrading endonuclease RelE of RelBE toxin-antitoxin system
MAKQPPFALIYAPAAVEHLDAIDAKYHSLIHTAIEEQLQFQAETPTRNRRSLTRPVEFGARWELRFGPQNRFRVFYRVDADQREVYILAIGVKDRERLIIGGEEVKL